MKSSVNELLSKLISREVTVDSEVIWNDQAKKWDAKVWIDGVKWSEWGDTFMGAVENALRDGVDSYLDENPDQEIERLVGEIGDDTGGKHWSDLEILLEIKAELES